MERPSKQGEHIVATYARLQEAAADYIQRKEEIPVDLYDSIQQLANAESGFTGLTVHEAFVGQLRKQRGQ